MSCGLGHDISPDLRIVVENKMKELLNKRKARRELRERRYRFCPSKKFRTSSFPEDQQQAGSIDCRQKLDSNEKFFPDIATHLSVNYTMIAELIDVSISYTHGLVGSINELTKVKQDLKDLISGYQILDQMDCFMRQKCTKGLTLMFAAASLGSQIYQMDLDINCPTVCKSDVLWQCCMENSTDVMSSKYFFWSLLLRSISLHILKSRSAAIACPHEKPISDQENEACWLLKKMFNIRKETRKSAIEDRLKFSLIWMLFRMTPDQGQKEKLLVTHFPYFTTNQYLMSENCSVMMMKILKHFATSLDIHQIFLVDLILEIMKCVLVDVISLTITEKIFLLQYLSTVELKLLQCSPRRENADGTPQNISGSRSFLDPTEILLEKITTIRSFFFETRVATSECDERSFLPFDWMLQ